MDLGSGTVISILKWGWNIVQNHKKKPKITFEIISPSKDDGNAYWHLLIKNEGAAINKGRIVLTGQMADGNEKQTTPFVRFCWPHEGADKTLPVERAIVKSQLVDLFSSREDRIPDTHGQLCLAYGPSDGQGNPLVNIPRKTGQSLFFSIQIIGENYQSPKDEWFCITKTDTSWSVEKKVPA